MHAESVLDRVSQELLAAYGVHTILLYGSHADGSAGPGSDYDIAAFGSVAEPLRIARLDAGVYLDIFVYPDALLLKPSEEYLKLRASKILMQRDARADAFLDGLDGIFRMGPVPLAADEIAARKVWARKMVSRIERADPEGNYRRAWLLQALLEDYFHIRGFWYEGPKKSLRWLAQSEPPTYQAFCAALEPGASNGAIASLVGLVAGPLDAARSETLTVTTSRGAKIEAVADFPVGPGPFPAVVLAPGQGYHMARPALEQTARQLVSQGVAVYRFNWAYCIADPGTGSPSADLADELQDLTAVLAAAAAEPRVSAGRLSVGGKSLGSVLAWRALASDKSLQSGLFLTPICSHVAEGKSAPDSMADENYPGLAAEGRPLLFISGDRDPLCAPAVLYRFAASSGGSARVAVVGGDHSYEDGTLTGAAADEVRTRNIGSVAQLAANFIVEASGK